MSSENSAKVVSIKRQGITEDVLMGAVINSGLSSLQIGFIYGVAPSYIRSLAIRNLGEEAFCDIESRAMAKLRSQIGELLLAGKSQVETARECGISNHAFRQLAAAQAEYSCSSDSICVVEDDDYEQQDLPEIGINKVNLKYLDFEISYTTEKDPEDSIIEICRFLIGDNNAAS